MAADPAARLPARHPGPLHPPAGLELASGEVGEVKGPTAVGTGQQKGEEVQLSTIIDKLNKLFGTEFNEGDRLFLDHIVEAG